MFLPPPGPPSDNSQPRGIELPPGIHDRVLEWLERGTSPEDVWRDLIAKGCSERQADELVGQAIQRRAHRYASQGIDINDPASLHAVGKRNLLLGAVLGVGGVVVTIGSFAVASQAGGYFLVTTGIIVLGITLFIRGLSQVANARVADTGAVQGPDRSRPVREREQRRARRGRK
jgi:hypothetical protein